MSINTPTPEMWDAAARAAREHYPRNSYFTIATTEPLALEPIEVAETSSPREEPVVASNPKQAYGDKKVPLHLVPGAASAYIAMGLKEGSRKYGAFNWRETDVEAMTYVGATMRHLAAFVDGEDTDVESGNPHLAHAMASLAILVDALESGGVIDNRPKAGPAAKTLEAFKND